MYNSIDDHNSRHTNIHVCKSTFSPLSREFNSLLQLYATDVNRNGHPQDTAASDWLIEDRGITLFLPLQSALKRGDRLEDDFRLLQRVGDVCSFFMA